MINKQRNPEIPTPEIEPQQAQIRRQEQKAPTQEHEPSNPGRRAFLRMMGGASALFAIDGCAAIRVAARSVERMTELADRHEALVKRWSIARDEGLDAFLNNAELKNRFGKEYLSAVAEIIRAFDLAAYIKTLADHAKIAQGKIGGEIFSFAILPNTDQGAMAAVKDMHHMELYLGEWMNFKGDPHAPTIHMVLRHETAHLFSFDYNAPPMDRIPLCHEEDYSNDRAYIHPHLYEGATEVVARTGLKYGEHGLSRGYQGGATLSAYILSELLGRDDFLRAYLLRDTRLLNRLFEEKIDKRAAANLTLPVSIGADFFNRNYTPSLDFLHNAFESPHINRTKLQQLLEQARQEGISERVEHFTTNGSSITTHLYTINDADNPPRHAFNAVARAPSVYRYEKIKAKIRIVDKSGKTEIIEEHPVTERFSIMVVNTRMSSAKHAELIAIGAESLKRHCSNQNPNTRSLVEAHTIIGYDGYIEERLLWLDTLDGNDPTYEKVWHDLNTHAQQMISDTITAIYKQAGVSELIVKDK